MAISNRTPGSYKGGSYANHPSMRYELPIPFTPCGPPSDAYRDNYDRIFGPKEPVAVPWPECDACGERANHRLDAGSYSCEIES